MRDNSWLKNQLNFLLKKYFLEVPITNPIEIKFGREAKYRFGSIKLIKGTTGIKSITRITSFLRNKAHGTRGTLTARDTLDRKVPQKSIITITSMFAKDSVPTSVVRYTISHELCHYAHGFSSSNKKLFEHPHHGGIVNRELESRGADELIHVFKKWLKNYRKKILAGRISV